MKQEVYRFAYEEANAELSQIMGEFEELRVRKDRIERVVEALKPLAMAEAQAQDLSSTDPATYSY